MTIEEKLELGKLLDIHRIKTIFYEETSSKGVYHILRYNSKDILVQEEILGEDLE